MIFLAIIRWLCGYVEFEIQGKFPERFINLTAKNGIALWNVLPDGEIIRARARLSDYRLMRFLTRKCKTRLRVKRRFGAIFLIHKYKHRMGLIAGAFLFVAICQVFSLFIWEVKVNAPNILSEYELREQLAENGVYVGALKSTVDKSTIERTLTLNNDNISWISINLMGTICEIEISPNIKSPNRGESIEIASNMKANIDGVITRIEVKNGKAVVSVGEGVVKDTLLVSGILEYANGRNVLVHSDAKIFAQTQRKIQVEVPYEFCKAVKNESTKFKRSINIMGLTIPLTLFPTPDESYIKSVQRENAKLFDTVLPITIENECFEQYKYITKKLNKTEAEKIALEKLKLQECFMVMSLNECTVLDRKYNTEIQKDKIIVTEELTLEENICRNEPIQIQAS